MEKILNFINSEKVKPLESEYIDNYEPATGKVYSQIASSGAKDLDLAVEAAQKAFPIWSSTPAAKRSQILNKVADLLESRLDEFAKAESKDQGKPLWLSKTVDIPRAIYNFRFFASLILQSTSDSSHMDEVGAINYTRRQPVGVAGLISPWNLPLYLFTWKLAPALAAGNTVICKPSEMTSMTAYMLADVLNEAGLPKGVCNILNGLGGNIGQAIVSHPGIPLISFTGGTETAKSIAKDSAPHFKKLSLELGGKNPNIIFADCDFEEALETTVKSSFTNQGEICLCGSRIFVEQSIYDQFLKQFIDKTKALTVGPSLSDVFMGALVSKEHRKKVESYIEEARKLGGTIECGGDRPDVGAEYSEGYYLNPTIITGLEPSCKVMQEEIFGPVVTLTPFSSEEEVLALANGVKYGLSATLWTSDVKRAHRMAEKIEAGTVWVNTWMKRDLRVPFGGVKQSGMGSEGGRYSLEFYTEAKNICIAYGK